MRRHVSFFFSEGFPYGARLVIDPLLLPPSFSPFPLPPFLLRASCFLLPELCSLLRGASCLVPRASSFVLRPPSSLLPPSSLRLNVICGVICQTSWATYPQKAVVHLSSAHLLGILTKELILSAHTLWGHVLPIYGGVHGILSAFVLHISSFIPSTEQIQCPLKDQTKASSTWSSHQHGK